MFFDRPPITVAFMMQMDIKKFHPLTLIPLKGNLIIKLHDRLYNPIYFHHARECDVLKSENRIKNSTIDGNKIFNLNGQ